MLLYLFGKLVFDILLINFSMEGLSYRLFTSLIIELLLEVCQFSIHLLLNPRKIIIGNFLFSIDLLVVEHIGGVVQFPLNFLYF